MLKSIRGLMKVLMGRGRGRGRGGIRKKKRKEKKGTFREKGIKLNSGIS
jgi:hypothetical protein